MKKLVVLSGAGISQQSGLQTFRDSDGLWENFRIEEIATPEAFARDPQKVLDFYNMRRSQLKNAKPNRAHEILFELESFFEVQIITQNVDDLHERAGSTSVLHLHGELSKVRSTDNLLPLYPWVEDLKLGDTDEFGVQLRPHIVWFGEEVPAMDEAIRLVQNADICLIIGTSLQVYPAAGLLLELRNRTPLYRIDPQEKQSIGRNHIHIEKDAIEGMIHFQEVLTTI
ncbi:SIR2 family NAD-dependent protein deacylase [Chryseobacterium sp. A301]